MKGGRNDRGEFSRERAALLADGRRCTVSSQLHQIALLEAGSRDTRALKTQLRNSKGRADPPRRRALGRSPRGPGTRSPFPPAVSRAPAPRQDRQARPGPQHLPGSGPFTWSPATGPGARAPACPRRRSPPQPARDPREPPRASPRPAPLPHTHRKRPRPSPQRGGGSRRPSPRQLQPDAPPARRPLTSGRTYDTKEGLGALVPPPPPTTPFPSIPPP